MDAIIVTGEFTNELQRGGLRISTKNICCKKRDCKIKRVGRGKRQRKKFLEENLHISEDIHGCHHKRGNSLLAEHVRMVRALQCIHLNREIFIKHFDLTSLEEDSNCALLDEGVQLEGYQG